MTFKHYKTTKTGKRFKRTSDQHRENIINKHEPTNWKEIITEATAGNIAYHGNYVGPGWSAGKYQNSVAGSNVPPIDEFDKTAKKHDTGYALHEKDPNNYPLEEIDQEFINENLGKGIKRTVAALAVKGAQVKRKQKFKKHITDDEHKANRYWKHREFTNWHRRMVQYGRTNKDPMKGVLDNETKTDPKSTRASTTPDDANMKRKRRQNEYNSMQDDINTLEASLAKTSNAAKQRDLKETINLLKLHQASIRKNMDIADPNNAGTNNDTEPATNLHSLSNLPSNNNMSNTKPTTTETNVNEDAPMELARAAGPAGMQGKHGGETQLSNIKYTIYRPYPSTNQVLMPFLKYTEFTLQGGKLANSAFTQTIRLNSIYDILTAHNFVDDGGVIGGTAAASDTAISGEQPQMRKFWAHIYNYYAVVQCNYKITVQLNTEAQNGQLVGYQYLHGQQNPPVLDAGGINVITHEYRKWHPDCQYQMVTTLNKNEQVTVGAPTNYAYNKVLQQRLNNRMVFRGTWYPGTIKHEVVEDENREIWTKMNTTPTNHEKLTLLLHRSPRSSDISLAGHIYTELQYVVQLKDLQTRYQYLDKEFDVPALADAFTDVP
jgi:hypothetical protein